MLKSSRNSLHNEKESLFRYQHRHPWQLGSIEYCLRGLHISEFNSYRSKKEGKRGTPQTFLSMFPLALQHWYRKLLPDKTVEGHTILPPSRRVSSERKLNWHMNSIAMQLVLRSIDSRRLTQAFCCLLESIPPTLFSSNFKQKGAGRSQSATYTPRSGK